jgi:two-component system sensor histidine kinase KdpD
MDHDATLRAAAGLSATGGPAVAAADPGWPSAALWSHGALTMPEPPIREGAGFDREIDILSHELRSPITSIQIGTKVLRDRAGSIPRPVRAEVVEAVEEEAERLYRLVEDLLAVVRHDAGRRALAVRPLLLQRWLPGVVAAEVDGSPSLRVRAAVPAGLPAVLADDGALTHVIRNLLANAVRHAPQGMPVEIVGRVGTDDRVSLDVFDHGPGIEAGDAERLFEPFYRARAAEARGTGAGLGLAAARRLVEAMGGSIDAGSPDDGKGARFSINLPVAPADDAPESSEAAAANPPS